MSDSDQKDWLKFALGVAVMVVTVSIAWGTLQTRVTANTERVEKIETTINNLHPIMIENKILLNRALEELREIKADLKRGK